MGSAIGIGIDVVMMCVLGATIFYGLRLSQKFDMLRADRKAFEQLISALNVAASRAEGAVAALKRAATEAGEGLQQKVNAARALADELEIVVEAGDNLAERLSQLAEKSRRATTGPEPEAPQARTRAERELQDAMQARQKT